MNEFFDDPRVRALMAITLAVALGCANAASARAQDLGLVSLRPAPETVADVVTLGDLFEGAGEAADIAVARAPAPGRSISLDPIWVARQAHAHGLMWNGHDQVMRVQVRRASQTIAAAELADLIADALSAGEGGEWIVALSGERLLHAPLDAMLDPRLLDLERDPRTGRLLALVELTMGGEPVRLSGRAEEAVAVIALTRAIRRGEVITADDLTVTRMPARRAPAFASGETGDMRALIGSQATRPLRAGDPITSADLAPPTAVAKGDVVMVVFQAGGLTLTARARAMEDAPVGGAVRLINLTSNRAIEATVEAPGRARVLARAPLSLTAQAAPYPADMLIGGRP